MTGAAMGEGDLVIRVDGELPLADAPLAAVGAVCDRAEDGTGEGVVIVYVSGTPEEAWTDGATVALVSRWERALRRLERLPAVTVAVVEGDCGGLALDALLATDFRIATPSARLRVSTQSGATWPGMSLYRLARQSASTAVRRALLFGTPLDASTALAADLVDEVTDDVAGALAATAGRSTGIPGAELAIRRQLSLDARTSGFEDSLGTHLAACDRALRRTTSEVPS
ncbi:enoyl-CoA-hydratase DpgB [Streptomyces canus]|uniref:enoyl-CoA-hydratase DpgB n=1 Tax=Streptomyces canus TaxID=58343 RepID=UPI0034078E7D